MVDLEQQSFFPILPLSQAPSSDVVIKPSITVIGENEFLLLSWTGENTLGVFITGEGMPVRGTLEWPIYPEAVCEPSLRHSGSFRILIVANFRS